MKLPQVEARRRNQGLRRRHEARSWSDVDVWHSLFHSPNPRRRGGEGGGGGKPVLRRGHSVLLSPAQVDPPPRELRSQYRAECRAGRTTGFLSSQIRVFLRTAKSGFLRRVIVHSTLLFLRPLSRWSAVLSLMPSILSELQACVHASSSE